MLPCGHVLSARNRLATPEGEFLWKVDVGKLNVGAYDLPSYEWGSASSPIIHDGKVIVQCHQQKGSFLLAVDVKTGETVWKTPRDELPSWGTPTVYPGGERAELVANGSNYYERIPHRAHGFSASPVAADGRIYLAGEDGLVFVVEAGPEMKLLGTHSVGEPLMATPALSDGILYLRGTHHLFAVGRPKPCSPEKSWRTRRNRSGSPRR